MVCEETNSNTEADECMPRLEQFMWQERQKGRVGQKKGSTQLPDLLLSPGSDSV